MTRKEYLLKIFTKADVNKLCYGALFGDYKNCSHNSMTYRGEDDCDECWGREVKEDEKLKTVSVLWR